MYTALRCRWPAPAVQRSHSLRATVQLRSLGQLLRSSSYSVQPRSSNSGFSRAHHHISLESGVQYRKMQHDMRLEGDGEAVNYVPMRCDYYGFAPSALTASRTYSSSARMSRRFCKALPPAFEPEAEPGSVSVVTGAAAGSCRSNVGMTGVFFV